MKTFTAAVLAATVASAAASPLAESQYQFLFSRFVEKYSKSYETSNFLTKYATFKKNLDYVMKHNETPSSYQLGMNEFGDMTQEEFSKFLNSHLSLTNEVFGSNKPVEAPLTDIDHELDWTQKIDNPVKNQGSCGSCWAFSVIGSMEYRYALSRGDKTATRFSEQQLVDCDRVDSGCNGGLMETAFNYVKNAGGVCLESDYPYVGRNDLCKSERCTKYALPKSTFAISGGEAGLVKELANGPVTVAVAASAAAFQFYRSGVLDDRSCGTGLNHAVLAVGYGPASGSQKAYIKIRNSWGASWGDKGYIRFAYGENICGLGSSISGGYDYVPVY